MKPQLRRAAITLAMALAVSGGVAIGSQDGGKAKDDALDSLLEKLGQAGPRTARQSEKSGEASKVPDKKQPSAPRSQAGSKSASRPAPTAGETQKPGAKKPARGSDSVAPKDKELDALLEKLGAAKDEPAPEDRPRNGGAAEQSKDDSTPGKPAATKLGGKDKEIDERLEEYTGRKKKRRQSDGERSGAIGQIIKEMRDVEERLGKPDTGDDTQSKQKQVVKRIQTLIEEVRRSGSQTAGMRIRYVRQPGPQPGAQPGDQTGALARGAPPMKPAKPTSRHSNVGGKDVWGHLPPELRRVMENSFKEIELSSKAELISRYFLSVSKGKLLREE
jgi:hypothetical protein